MYIRVDENGKTHFTDDVSRVPNAKIDGARQNYRDEGLLSPRTVEQKIKAINHRVKKRHQEIDEAYGSDQSLSKKKQIAKIQAKLRISEKAFKEIKALQLENSIKQNKNKLKIQRLEKILEENEAKLKEIQERRLRGR